MRSEFPKFRIVHKKNSRLSHVIDWALRLVTLGGLNKYLTQYHTVLGSTLYVAPTWSHMDPDEQYVLLCHEHVHLRQRRRLTLPGMAIVYLLPILPLGLAYGRARLEWEAYRATLRARAEVWGLEAVRDTAYRREIVERFLSADYGWMWPFPRTVGRWYDLEIAQLESDVGPKSTM